MIINRIYMQEIPAMRFIGKKYGDADRINGGFGDKWAEFFNAGHFETIEKAAGGSDKLHELYEDGDAYIGLMRCKDGEPFEYWIGEFVPAGTETPDGFECVDFAEGKLGAGWLYGNEQSGELYCHEEDVARMLGEEGMKLKNFGDGACWFFERYQCPRFTTPDEKGNVILDICFFIEG